MQKDEDVFRNVIWPAITAMLALTSGVLILFVLFTNLGNMKNFCFLTGEVAMMTALAYSFGMAREKDKFAPFGAVIWFLTGSVYFARAVWFLVK